LLKVGDGGLPPVYATVAGLRTTQLSINGDAVVVTNKDSGAWRELLSGAGVRSVSVSGAGVFTGSVAETRIKTNALSGAGLGRVIFTPKWPGWPIIHRWRLIGD
jgi:TP901-1 family phage major tail protein